MLTLVHAQGHRSPTLSCKFNSTFWVMSTPVPAATVRRPATFLQLGTAHVGTAAVCMTWHQALQRVLRRTVLDCGTLGLDATAHEALRVLRSAIDELVPLCRLRNKDISAHMGRSLGERVKEEQALCTPHSIHAHSREYVYVQ